MTFREIFQRADQWDIPEWIDIVGDLSPADDKEDCCGTSDPEIGFQCTLPEGHEGLLHVASGGDSEDGGVYSVWSVEGVIRS